MRRVTTSYIRYVTDGQGGTSLPQGGQYRRIVMHIFYTYVKICLFMAPLFGPEIFDTRSGIIRYVPRVAAVDDRQVRSFDF